ncbi:MAG TPA: OmpH family outer membrane protein [Flavobacteriales bacterium]|nr:OmpH family outer membrane protein [Flavobacteriales bacterium]
MPIAQDSAALSRARIAFFRMDSLRVGYELIKEKDQRFIAEGRRLEAGLQEEQAKARDRYRQLMEKDQTYSTKAEMERDEAELRALMEKLQGMQAAGEERLARMEGEMLKEIATELEDYLKEFNSSAGYDYIFSVQGGGQVWVGNEGLDITQQLVNGLNARHRASKAGKK